MRSALLWDFMQHRLIECYRRFRTTYRSHLQGGPLSMGCLSLEDGTDRLFINISNKLPIYTA